MNTRLLPFALVAVAGCGASTQLREDNDGGAVADVPVAPVARIPVACDDLTTGAVIPEAVGDDVGTVAVPLPIRFPYFGSSMVAWSASTNGYLQVWPTAEGRSNGVLTFAALPSARAPTNMIAPFWEDLFVAPGNGMDLRWLVVAAPAPHLTVQWTNVGFCCGSTFPDRVTFQAKLFESGAVEFHYCAQSGAPRTHGANASVGLQDADGTRGLSVQWGAPTVDATTAYRLTPPR